MSHIVAKAKSNKFKAIAKEDKVINSIGKPQGLPGIQGPEGPEGPIGPQGPPGAGTAFPTTAGEEIQAYDAVYVENDLAFIASNDDSLHFLSFAGLAAVGASITDPIDIITDGLAVNPAWSWTANQEVFLGTNGQLTQTPPDPISSNYRIVVGEVVASDRIIVRISEPILFDT